MAITKLNITAAKLKSHLGAAHTYVQSWLPFSLSDVDKLDNGIIVPHYIYFGNLAQKSLRLKNEASDRTGWFIPQSWEYRNRLYTIQKINYLNPAFNINFELVTGADDQVYYSFSRSLDGFEVDCEVLITGVPSNIENSVARNERLEAHLKEYQRFARENIKAQEKVPALLYDEQELTLEERAQARANIRLVQESTINEVIDTLENFTGSTDTFLDFKKSQNFSEEMISNGRSTIKINPVPVVRAMRRPVGIDSNGRLWVSGELDNTNLKEIIRSGLMPSLYQIGDQIEITINKPSLNTKTLIFRVLGFDYDSPTNPQIQHTVSLGLESVLYPKIFAIGEKQAFGYFRDGLPIEYKDGKILNYNTIQGGLPRKLALTKAIPPNEIAQLMVTSWSGTAPQNGVIYTNLTDLQQNVNFIYGSEASAPTIADCSVTQESHFPGGADKTKYPNILDLRIDFNAIYNAAYGNNRYLSTNYVHKFLNSDTAEPNGWWRFDTSRPFERPPQANIEGFLYGIEEELSDLIIPVKKKVWVKDNADPYFAVIRNAKAFLPSAAELGIEQSDISMEETSSGISGNEIIDKPYPYYAQDPKNRIKYDLNGSPCEYLTRTAKVTTTYQNYYVNTAGNLSSSYSSYACGISPIIVLGA